MTIKFSKEEKIIIELLFSKKSLNKTDFEKFDFEKFVKISSSHLILPLIFVKLNEKKLLQYFPDELVKYLKKIYKINFNRNKELLKETNIIIDVFKENKINYVLLKGAANIFRNLYKDIGERMIGDIDILVDLEDAEKAVELLNKIDYFNLTDDIFFDFRHLKRIIHKKKLFAVEIHTRLFDSNSNFVDINDREKINDVTIFKKNISTNYNIYNFQINDFGYLRTNYSYRNLYDHFLLSKDEILNTNTKIDSDKLKKRYFLIAKELGIKYFLKYNIGNDMFGLIRFRLKNKFKFYKVLEEIYFILTQFIKNLPKKVLLLIKNKKYRIYILKKIRVQLSGYFPI